MNREHSISAETNRQVFHAYAVRDNSSLREASNPLRWEVRQARLKQLGQNQEPDRKTAEPAVIYRNSSQCKPFHHTLHTFESSQFGDDFTCESNEFEHWFDAEAFFCAAAFSDDNRTEGKILSVISMLFVTEESALDFLAGKISEQELKPFKGNAGSQPIVYFSSLAAANFNSLVPLYKMLLKDIAAYKTKYNVTPSWGFSIAATQNGLRYLENSGFYKTAANNFLNKYDIVKIDCRSTQSKIWTSILRQPTPMLPTHKIKNVANIATKLCYPRDAIEIGRDVNTMMRA